MEEIRRARAGSESSRERFAWRSGREIQLRYMIGNSSGVGAVEIREDDDRELVIYIA